MKKMRRHRAVSAAERREIWNKWRAGASYAELIRLFQRSASVIWRQLRATTAPAFARPHKRNESQLTVEERETISRGLAQELSLRRIAHQLGRAISTVSREVARNGGRRRYRAQSAELRSRHSAARPKPCKLSQHPKLRQLVVSKLYRRWSPEQISGWLKAQHPEDEAMQISHETIYRSLFIQARGVLKQELVQYLRTQRSARKPRMAGGKVEKRGKILDAVSIRERPAEADDRAVPGHWEGDLLVGTHGSYIATLVERSSRFVMLIKLPNKQSNELVSALAKRIRTLPEALRRSLTWDRGHEMALHKQLTIATDLQVFFCDPHSPWQRGSNENTNGLLRQYFPKGQSLSHVTQAELTRVERELNGRPRETLGFRTPAETLAAALQ